MTQDIRKIDFARLFKTWSSHKIETLNDFRAAVERSLNLERRQIEERLAELQAERADFSPDAFDDYQSNLEIDAEDLGLVKEVSDEVSIVALYKTTEFYLKRILVRAFHKQVNPKEIMSYNITNIKKLFKKKNIDIGSFKQFPAVDELRVLNNAIKHQGKVTPELAKFRGWKEGDELRDLDVAYDRIAPNIPGFVEDVSRKAF